MQLQRHASTDVSARVHVCSMSEAFTNTPVKNQIAIDSLKKSKKSVGKIEGTGKVTKRRLTLIKKSNDMKNAAKSDEKSSDDSDEEVLEHMAKDMNSTTTMYLMQNRKKISAKTLLNCRVMIYRCKIHRQVLK